MFTLCFAAAQPQVRSSILCYTIAPRTSSSNYPSESHARLINTYAMASEPKCGGVSDDPELNKEEHAERIGAALATTDGHAGKAYKLHRVTKQVVAGVQYVYFISFENEESGQQYKITVWERPWLKEKDPAEARKITFEVHNG